MYISRASNFRDFRNSDHEIKYSQIFGIAHHREFICIEYQHFPDMICNILGII